MLDAFEEVSLSAPLQHCWFSCLQVTLTDYEHKVLLNLRESVIRNITAPGQPALGPARHSCSEPAETSLPAPCDASQAGSKQRLVSANGGSGSSSRADGEQPSTWEMVSIFFVYRTGCPTYPETPARLASKPDVLNDM